MDIFAYGTPRMRRLVIIAVVIALVVFLAHVKKQQDSGFMPTSGNAGSSVGGMGYGMDGDMYYDKGVALREESMARVNTIAPSPMPPTMPGGSAPLTDVMQDDRYIVRSANMSAVVPDLAAAITAINAKAKEWSAFVTNSSTYDYGNAPSASLTLRIPVEGFDAALQYFRSTYRVTSENISGEDVTEQVVDNEARLEVLKASETQFMAIMKNAVKIEDVLNVQQQLERVRSEIDSLTARLEYLKRSAALSTITISLTTEQEELPIVDPSEKWSPLATFKQAIRNVRELAQDTADFLILNIFYIIAVGIAYVGYRIYKKARR